MLCFVCLRPVSCAHCCLCLWFVYSNYFLFVSTLTLGLLYGLVLLIFFVLYVVFCLSSSCVLCPFMCLWIVYSNYFLFVSTLTLGLLHGLVPLIFFVLYVVFCLSSSCVLCIHCCQCLWIFHSWLPLRFSLTFIHHDIKDHVLQRSHLKSVLWHTFHGSPFHLLCNLFL